MVSTAQAFTVYTVSVGGTGTSTAPTYGKVLIGGLNGEYEFVASSTFSLSSSFSTTSTDYWLTQRQGAAFSTTSADWWGSTKGYITGIAWGAITGTLASQADLSAKFATKLGTSSALTANQLLYATAFNTTASVGTSTLTASSPLTGSFTQIGSGGSLGCQTASGSQAGCLASADWTTFNSKVSSSSLTAVFPLVYNSSTGAFSFSGLSTSSAPTAGNLAYWTGANTLGNAATTSATCAGTVSCTSFTVLGASPITITGSASGGGAGGGWTFIKGGIYNSTTTDQVFIGETSTTTTAKLEINGGLFASASSTIAGPFTTINASTTNLTVASNMWFPGFTNGPLAVDTAGKVYKAATTTYTSPLTYSGGAATIQAASASQHGYLSSSDYGLLHTASTTFTYPLIYTNSTNAVTFPATSTLYGSGTAGQVLMWSGITGKPQWAATSSSGGGTWGSITGTLASQADLDAAFKTKIGTSSAITAPQVLYATGFNTVASVATGTVSSSGGITTTAARYVLGGALSIACDVASGSIPGCLSTGDWNTFNGKESTLTFNTPLIRNTNAISWSGLATTSQPASSNVLVSNGGAGVYGAATTTVDCAGTVSCTQFKILGTSPITITGSGGGDPFTHPAPSQSATTSLMIFNTGGLILNAASSTIVGNATTTGMFEARTASSTFTYGAGLIPCTAGNVLTWTGGKFGCASDAQGSGSWPYTTTDTNFGVAVQSTTTPLWMKTPASGNISFMASSTAWLQYASTTAISASATSTFSGGLQVTGGAFSLSSIGTAIVSAVSGVLRELSLSSAFSLSSNTLSSVTTPSFTYATSTSWTGTTTVMLQQAINASTLNGVRCKTDTGTVNIQFGIGTASTTMLNASTTNNFNAYTANNSVSAGNILSVDIGTPASSPTKVNCTTKFVI